MAEEIPDCPFALFDSWFIAAKTSEINDPDAMAVACIDESGLPSVRMVLMRKHDKSGFCFFTNKQSRKGKGLLRNPSVEACFHWKSLRKQIRILGKAEETTDAESDAYHNSRGRGNQLAAWASNQSAEL